MEALLDKAAILEKMETEYQTFVDLLEPLDGWQMTSPGAAGGWSIKDVLIHLTAWQVYVVKAVQAMQQGREPAPLVGHLCDKEIERQNQNFYAAARARPLSDVWTAFRITYAQARQAIEALSEEALLDSGRFARLYGIALYSFIACSTYEHYQEHQLWVRAWLEEK